MKKVLIKLKYLFMRLFGFKGGSASLMLNALKRDIANKDVPLPTKIWAWRKGFMGSRVYTYGINEQNYKNHMPDFDYFKLHPINGRYSSWIDDKLTMKYLLAPFNNFLPKYYFQIKDNAILKLMDCPDGINPDIDGIISLLERDTNIALKLLSGSLGRGFYRLTYENGVFRINTKDVSLDKMTELIGNANGYLATEYVTAHEEIRRIYDVTPNTLRIQLTRDRNKNPKITGGFMRFGTKKSGLLEIAAAGTIFTAVNFKNGLTYNPKRKIGNNLEIIRLHPDTNESLEIALPNWSIIKEKLFEISNFMPQLSYLGFDIIITDNGFKIIEINSLSALAFLPYYYPFFEDEYCKEFFKKKFKEKPNSFKRILKILES